LWVDHLILYSFITFFLFLTPKFAFYGFQVDKLQKF